VITLGVSSSKYAHSSVQNVQAYLVALPGYRRLMKVSPNPFTGGYTPELDESPDLDPIKAKFLQSHIGILRWCVELGRIDIMTEV
jgi:hypothetical protein